ILQLSLLHIFIINLKNDIMYKYNKTLKKRFINSLYKNQLFDSYEIAYYYLNRYLSRITYKNNIKKVLKTRVFKYKNKFAYEIIYIYN
ncbi:MAG: hypothetical protein ACK5B9_05240, partial [Flavobacteriia bacterium]